MGGVTGIHNPFLPQIAEQAFQNCHQPFDYIRAPVLGLVVDEAAELGDGNIDILYAEACLGFGVNRPSAALPLDGRFGRNPSLGVKRGSGGKAPLTCRLAAHAEQW